MPKDFAARPAGNKPRKKTRKPARRRASPVQRTLFHGPSFSFGILLGAAIVLAGLYAPEIIDSGSLNTPSPLAGGDEASIPQKKSVQFEFPDLLERSEVTPQPNNYPIPEQSNETQPNFLIQAASFRSSAEANQLRAQLLLLDLPAYTEPSQVNNTTWHRVIVGPFDRRVEADRALTTLREQRLAALMLSD
ncbi:MAG: SPOR domain-containing protein [Pseudomonadota bacterium]